MSTATLLSNKSCSLIKDYYSEVGNSNDIYLEHTEGAPVEDVVDCDEHSELNWDSVALFKVRHCEDEALL